MPKLTHQEIVNRQIQRSQETKLPLVVVVDDVRSLNNVGSLFRTCDGAGVQKLYLCGITGYPPQAGISKTALGAEENVVWEYAKDISCVVQSYKDQGYSIAILEQMQESLDYTQYQPQGPVCLVVGNEVDGVNDKLVSLCDTALEIHMAGIKNSLNVSVAAGIVIYDLRHKLLN